MDYFRIRILFTEHQKKHIMFKQHKNNFKPIYTAIYQIKRWDIEKKVLGANSLSKFGSQYFLKNLSFGDINKSFHIFEEI